MTLKFRHIILLIAIAVCSCKKEAVFPTYDFSDARLKINAAKGLIAGSPLKFYIETKEKSSEEMLLAIDNGLTVQTYNCSNNSTINLPIEAFRQAGLYKLRVIHKDQILVSKQLKIKAGQIIAPLEVYTGPTTIIVGAKQPSMATTIPADQYDNGISYQQTIHYESEKGLLSDEPITNLYSSLEFSSDDEAKKILIGVSKDKISSTEQSVKETPDWGSNYQIETIDQYPYADNRQYTKLRTSRIYDIHKNQIADGTLVNFEIFDATKLVGSYKALIIDGVANIFIKNPSTKTTWKVRSSIGDYASSNTLQLTYQNNLKELQWAYDDFGKTIKVGPLRSVLGQFVPDGTIVTIATKGEKYSQETYGGYTTFKLVELNITHKEKVKLTCSGLEKEIQL